MPKPWNDEQSDQDDRGWLSDERVRGRADEADEFDEDVDAEDDEIDDEDDETTL